MLATAAGAIIGWPFSAVLGWVMLVMVNFSQQSILHTTYYIKYY